jgi:hypothetical protein
MAAAAACMIHAGSSLLLTGRTRISMPSLRWSHASTCRKHTAAGLSIKEQTQQALLLGYDVSQHMQLGKIA